MGLHSPQQFYVKLNQVYTLVKGGQVGEYKALNFLAGGVTDESFTSPSLRVLTVKSVVLTQQFCAANY